MLPALFYLGLITLAELLTATISSSTDFVRVGLSLHSIILVVLILHGATARKTFMRRLLLTLALAPLIRILSISLPLQNLPLIDWYLIIGALLYLAAFVAARILGLSWRRMGLVWRGWPWQLLIALLGFGLGFIEFVILGPRPLIDSLSWETFLFPAFVLMVFTGFLEEIIFRGLIQDVSTTLMGRLGIWYGAVLFAVLHIGYLSFVDVLFVFGVGLLFGYIVQRTRSLVGVSLAHGFTNISMYLIYPFVVTSGFFSSQPSRPPQELLILPATSLPAYQQTPVLVLFVTPTPSLAGPQMTPTVMPFTATGTVPLPTTTSETPTSTATGTTVTPAQTAIPTPNCVVPPGWVSYTVRSGDTLYGISQMFRITVAQLQNANCLTTTVINTGQKLYVPFVPTSTPFVAPETNTPMPATATDTPPAPTETNTPTLSPPAPTDTLPPDPTETPEV